MSEEKSENAKLTPSLGLFDATSISVGAIIGAGIFVVTGIVAGFAGSALIISMIIAAVIALFTALSFAELTAWQPKEGSIYEYTYTLISPFAGFLVGWMWLLANTFTGAAVSLGFAYYLTAVFPSLNANVTAATMCIIFTVLNFLGAHQSALVNNFLVAAKLLILAFFVVFGLMNVRSANFVPFAPFEVGVFYGACYIFFAYGGFARVAVLAEEVKDAKRNVPKAILLSLVISTVVYILVGIVAVGLVGASELANSNSPLADAINASGSPAAFLIISAGGLLATASVSLTCILGVSRMAYAMARRGDIPHKLSELHAKYNTPYYSIWIVGVLMSLLVFFIDLSQVVAVSTFSLLFYYALANVAALRLETTDRMFPKIVPVLGIVTCMILWFFILFASPRAWSIGVAALILGAAVYYVAKERKHNILKAT